MQELLSFQRNLCPISWKLFLIDRFQIEQQYFSVYCFAINFWIFWNTYEGDRYLIEAWPYYLTLAWSIVLICLFILYNFVLLCVNFLKNALFFFFSNKILQSKINRIKQTAYFCDDYISRYNNFTRNIQMKRSEKP